MFGAHIFRAQVGGGYIGHLYRIEARSWGRMDNNNAWDIFFVDVPGIIDFHTVYERRCESDISVVDRYDGNNTRL